MSGSFRASGGVAAIPSNVRKTIQNIREIAGNHSDDEIYTMLRECSMDPNETANKLLLQDTFHEVKRKRDRKKEIPNSREPGDSRWRPGVPGRGGRGGRGSYSPRYVAHDASGGRNWGAAKENGVNQVTEKGSSTSLPASQEVENKANSPISSSVTPLANGLASVVHGDSTHELASQVSAGSDYPPSGGIMTQEGPSSDQPAFTPAPVSGLYSSASDPVLVPSLDSRVPGVVGTIKREVGSQRTAVEPGESKMVQSDFSNRLQINQVVSHEPGDQELSSSNEKASSEIGNPFLHGTVVNKSQLVERNQLSEVSHSGSSVNRSSSNYTGRAQQLVGSQKVGPSKEWKPKSTNPNPAQVSGSINISTGSAVTGEVNDWSMVAPSTTYSEETVSKLQKKIDELHFSDGQVIIPNHLQVPEAERTALSFGSFGSFDISFGMSTTIANDHDIDKSSTPLSESSEEEIEETADEPSSCIENASPTAEEGDYADQPESPVHMPERLSSAETDVSATIAEVPESDQSKSEVVLTPGEPQYSVVHTGPSYSTFGLMPPMLGSQFAPFDSSESQAREVPRLPSFVVQQPFDPSTSFYTPFFRPGSDGDARFSPFLAPGAATKYNGGVSVLSSQTGQSPQESGNSIVPSTASPSPLATQAAGVLQSSIALTQQPVPVFRQPAGVQISHIPPGYFPYNQFMSPFYVQPPIHHFLTNPAFPQQPPAGGIYSPPAAAAAAVKYSLSPYKPGTNSGNSTHIGMPAGYGSYSSAPSGYSPSPTVTAGNSTGNDDLTGSQYKENNVYIAGQLGEGSGVWVPGRDISGLPASSFYNLPPQGQHLTFAPTQAGHGAFAGIYHPTQTVAAATVHPLLQQPPTMSGAAEMVGPQAGVYQQPQRPQINWTNNY